MRGEYERRELSRIGVQLEQEEMVKVKFIGPKGETRWLSITPDAFSECAGAIIERATD